MESLEPVGWSTFFADLEAALPGRLTHRLANCTDDASSVIWPEPIAGETLFNFDAADELGARDGRAALLSEAVRRELGCVVDWAT